MENGPFLLTVKEASKVYRIGENTLRRLIREPKCSFVLFIGTKAMIKREKFEKFLENLYSM